MTTVDYIILAMMCATFGVLLVGIVLMMIGGKGNAKYSNKLMIARVALQASVVVLLGFLYFMSK